MPEQLDRLRATLTELENELSTLDTADPSARRMLEEAAAEIIAVLERGERTESTQRVEGTLRDRVVEFEADHPTLAAVLHRLVDILGQMGI